MFDVLNATARPTKHPLQCRLALNQRPAPDVITRNKKIESTGHGFLIGCAAVQGSKSATPLAEKNNFGINNQGLTEPSRFLHNPGIALGPIIAVHRVEPHATVTDMDLQP